MPTGRSRRDRVVAVKAVSSRRIAVGVLAIGTVGLFVTLAAVLAPPHLARRPASVVPTVVETSVVLVGTLLSLLAFGRYRRSHAGGDLLISAAAFLLAWAYILFGVAPDLISPNSVGNGVSERVEVWGMILLRTLAAWYLIRSARVDPSATPRRRTERSNRIELAVPALVGMAFFGLLVAVAPIGGHGLFDQTWADSLSSVVKLADGGLFFTAFACLWRRAEVRQDAFLGWIAAGSVFAGFAMINYALLQPDPPASLPFGDILASAAVCTWAIGAVCEILSYWDRIAQAAASEIRRTLAIDLHDGLAQELALLATQTYASIEDRANPEWHDQLQATAGRALEEARRAIVMLRNDAVPFAADIERTVGWLSRPEVDIEVDIDDTLNESTSDMQRETIVRIVREAVTNAVRHGSAHHIAVTMKGGCSPQLRVVDDGVGFDVDRLSETGRVGLVSVRERAEAMGATLAVRSSPGAGTAVEVSWS